jgi:O-antigen/teichoic acid export membrane protein
MKISTWIDRLAGVVLALAIARVLGPQALGEWTLILLTVWVLSPWPEGSLTTRLGAGALGLAGVGIVAWVWPGGWERHALLWTVAAGMFSVRILHALPGNWRWRVVASGVSLIAGMVTLVITKSVFATTVTISLMAGAAALVGSIRYRASFGAFAPIDWRVGARSLLMMLMQAQPILWVYARGLSETAVGDLAAVLFLLEFLKGGLVLMALRFDAALARFSQTRESFLETVRSIAAYSLLIMPPIVLAVYFVTGPLINGILGAEFSASVALLRILIWGFGLSFLSIMGSRVLAAQNYSTFIARACGGVFEATLDWFWIPLMGLEGACYAHVAGEALSFMLIGLQMYRSIPDLVNPFRKTFG